MILQNIVNFRISACGLKRRQNTHTPILLISEARRDARFS